MAVKQALQLEPVYRDYVWGGRRLRPEAERTAEAWVVYEQDRILSGLWSGLTLGEAAAREGQTLLGSKPFARTGTRFPLLIKLLDCADWLSLQVHPDDKLAVEMEGPGQFGKTEAWHFIETQPGAKILCGLKPQTAASTLREAILNGTLLEHMLSLDVHAGESIFIPAGMIHALGPGMLVYEVQQTSDWTYRVYDWGRPATPQRPLHLEKSIQASKPDLSGALLASPQPADGSRQRLITCDYFTLEMLQASSQPIQAEADETSFHTLTLINGSATLEGEGWDLRLERFQSALIPAGAGRYQVTPRGAYQALRASVA
jgi:mannose-6-phosphate isomerase